MSRLNLLSSVQALPRDLRLLFVALFLWTFGLGIYTFIWSLYLTQLNATPEQVGLVASIGGLSAAVSMIPGGILANKYDAKILLIAGWAASIPVPILFYYAGTWSDVIPGLIILQLSAFNLPAMNAFIGELADGTRTSSAFGAVYSSAPLGLIISPALGGILLGWLAIRDLFWITLAFWTVSTLILLPVRPQPPRKSDLSARLVELPKSQLELAIFTLLFGAAAAFSITSPSYLPLYFQSHFGLTDSQVNLLGSLQALGSAVFTVLLGRWATSRHEGSMIATQLVVVAGGVLGIVLAESSFLLVPLVFLVGGARATSPVAYSLLSKMKNGKSRAGRFGFYLTFEQLGIVVGSLVGGLLYSRSVTSVFFTTTILLLLLGVISALRIRSVVSSRPEPEP
jgi:MFS family permease